MNRGDAAAATWRFRGTKSRRGFRRDPGARLRYEWTSETFIRARGYLAGLAAVCAVGYGVTSVDHYAHFRRADLPLTNRGDAAAATWIFL